MLELIFKKSYLPLLSSLNFIIAVAFWTNKHNIFYLTLINIFAKNLIAWPTKIIYCIFTENKNKIIVSAASPKNRSGFRPRFWLTFILKLVIVDTLILLTTEFYHFFDKFLLLRHYLIFRFAYNRGNLTNPHKLNNHDAEWQF